MTNVSVIWLVLSAGPVWNARNAQFAICYFINDSQAEMGLKMYDKLLRYAIAILQAYVINLFSSNMIHNFNQGYL